MNQLMLCFYKLSRYIITRYRNMLFICNLRHDLKIILQPCKSILIVKISRKVRVNYSLYYNEEHPSYSWFSYEHIPFKGPIKTITISRFGQTNTYRIVYSNGYGWKNYTIKLNYNFISCIRRWYKKLIINIDN